MKSGFTTQTGHVGGVVAVSPAITTRLGIWAAIIRIPSSTSEYEATHEMGHALGFQDLIRGLYIYSYMMSPGFIPVLAARV